MTSCKNPIFRHIKSNNSGTAKVKIVKNERDPPLFIGKLLIKFQNILRNTTHVIIRHRVKILFSRRIKSNNSGTAKVKIVKNERDPPLFTGKLLIKFQNILRNTTQVIIRHRVKILFSRHIKSNNSGTAKVKIVKNERDPPLFTGKLLIKFQNILRNTTQVIIWHRVKILFSVISSPITLERQKWKSSKKKGILLSSPVSSW